MGRLDGKIALVTGAARGIGEAISEAFVREGATVILSDIRNSLGRKVAERLGAQARYEHLDVRDEGHWTATVDRILDRFGCLDVLVNNAAITGLDEALGPHDPEHATLEAWSSVHRTNADGVFLGCKHGIRAMRPAGRGSIINMSSRSGLVGIPGAAAYASSKASVRNHTKTVALYCAQEGLDIRCNSVHPAAVFTPMWDAFLGEGREREERMLAVALENPLRRWGTTSEVAETVVFLASDEAPFITGAEINIDGGLLAGDVEPKPKG